MKRIKMAPINYKALAKDIEAVRLERRGNDTGRFKPMRFGKRALVSEVREAREKAGLDLSEFAEALGLRRNWLGHIECGNVEKLKVS